MAMLIHSQDKDYPRVLALETDGHIAYLEQKQGHGSPARGFVEVDAIQATQVIEYLFKWLLEQDIDRSGRLFLRLGKHYDTAVDRDISASVEKWLEGQP